jgi:hypothetical protein
MTQPVRRPNVRKGEEGHAETLPGMVVAAGGAIALGVGAASDMGWLSIVGGVVLGVGIIALSVLQHMKIDYGMYERLEKLEKK